MYVFLDLDGTLTDPKLGITRSVAYALERLGYPVPELDDLSWVIGPALVDSFRTLGVEDPLHALDLYRERFADVGLFENSVYSGIPEVLGQLRDHGFHLNIATAKPHVYARRITAHFGLSESMDYEFGPELDGTRNDKGELLAYALEFMRIKAEQAVMVGDRIHDIQAAEFVGMRSIGVTWGYGSGEETSHADHICETPLDLPKIIGSIFSDLSNLSD